VGGSPLTYSVRESQCLVIQGVTSNSSVVMFRVRRTHRCKAYEARRYFDRALTCPGSCRRLGNGGKERVLPLSPFPSCRSAFVPYPISSPICSWSRLVVCSISVPTFHDDHVKSVGISFAEVAPNFLFFVPCWTRRCHVLVPMLLCACASRTAIFPPSRADTVTVAVAHLFPATFVDLTVSR